MEVSLQQRSTQQGVLAMDAIGETLKNSTLNNNRQQDFKTQCLPLNAVEKPRGVEPAQRLTSRQCKQREGRGGFAERLEARRQRRKEKGWVKPS